MAYTCQQRCNLQTLLLLLIGTCSLICESGVTRPHIIVILADDFGWSDPGYRDKEMYTPNIDRMIRQGVHMTSSYVNQVCTPSRAAFLSGRYPFKMGLQHSVFLALQNNSMPVNMKILPQHLKELRYSTHYVGKWHLGFCSVKMTPTGRGFDSFYGMYNGEGEYWKHISKWEGYDMHYDNGTNYPGDYHVAWEAKGKYSTHLFTDKTVEILKNHDKTKPLFLMLSYQAVHGPVEVPSYYVKTFCSKVSTGNTRKRHCAMTAAMDEGIGNITSVLKRLGYWDNLILIFLSDNGGPVPLGSSNWPLRGSKITLWEGGTRVVTVMQSEKYLPKAPYRWNGMMHAIDWYPTLMKAAGYHEPIRGIDGVDNWKAIVGQKDSMRTEFVYNIDEVKGVAAIRQGKYKLHRGTSKPDGWFNPPAGVKPPLLPRGRPVTHLLYDLEADPSEKEDLSEKEPAILRGLLRRLEKYEQDLLPTEEAEKVKAGVPTRHNMTWVTGWCDDDAKD